MKKKILLIGALLFLAAGIFGSHFLKNVYACEGDESGATNCSEDSLLVSPQTSEADPESSSKATSKSSSEAGNAYFDSSENASSSLSVEHSRFLAGSAVSGEDSVDGVYFLAGNTVSFDGTAEYGVFAGNSIVVNGDISRDLFAAGNAITLSEDANISRDAFLVGTSVTLDALMNGNVFVAGNRIVLENITIAGDLSVDAGEIIIKGRSSVAGNFKYNEDAKITGLENLNFASTEKYSGHNTTVGLTFAANFADTIIGLLGRLLLMIVLLALAPKFSKSLLKNFEAKNSWKDLLLGLGLLLGIPLAAIFIVISVIGIPLGLALALGYLAMVYLSHCVAGGVLGSLIFDKLLKKPNIHLFIKYSAWSRSVV